MTFPSDGDTSLSAWAAAYAEFGWPVFPLAPRNKQPLTPRGFHDATVHPDQIADWWTMWPEANIGLPTGISFDVLDIDGPEAAAVLRSHIPQYTHAGPVSRTGKGWHFLFCPTGRGNGAKLLGGAAIDFRGLGGYIVAPPSIHPKGHRYAWVTGRDYSLPLPEPPDWLLPILTREAKPPRQVGQNDPLRTKRENDYLREIGAALPDQLPRGIRGRANRPDIREVWETRFAAPLRDRGHYLQTSCPFHEDSTPSFTLYPDNTFHCYGCGAHGDSWDLDKDEPTHI